MTDTKECPECGSYNTERVHVEWFTYDVEEVRVCDDCPTQYTLNYADPVIANQETYNE